jgi:hypothetical protein
MSVQDFVDRVVEVLSRAESLFATPADSVTSRMTGAVDDASEASRGIGARTDELGGALASAHHGVLDTIARRLDDVGDTDSQFIDHLTRSGHVHTSGGTHAIDLRAGAEQIPSRIGLSNELPASELAGLLAPRNRVAGMQRLLAEHTSQAAHAADDIHGLTYQP